MQAGIEGLVRCPACNYREIVDNPCDLIFECANAACGVRSCRACKVKDRTPMSCAGTAFC
jgi:TRIAD3 protein (E3 ubiquitin-protein ligase RNF216)